MELSAYVKNVEWLKAHDPYAGLLVSMHRTGLWENRYNTFTSPKGRLRERSAEVKAVKQELEAKQQDEKRRLGGGDARFKRELWFNFRMLQIYDLLSLYFCCDGHTRDGFEEDLIAPVPLAYDSREEMDLRLTPAGLNSVKMVPYPFDASPLRVSVRARIIPAGRFSSVEECSEAYHKAPRSLLTFEISS